MRVAWEIHEQSVKSVLRLPQLQSELDVKLIIIRQLNPPSVAGVL